jgi:hypothetical protein
MNSPAADLAQRLAQNVEAVCLTYLSNGRRAGNYWVVGDAQNNSGKSLFVRLRGPDYGPGARGKWTDSATGERGDLLDLIKCNRGFSHLRDVLGEARSFLSLPHPVSPPSVVIPRDPVPQGSAESARRLFSASRPLRGTLAERYLQGRHLQDVATLPALRYHPRCYCRPEDSTRTLVFPALIAAVTDLAGSVTGVHRTWLDPAGGGKAPLEDPRRAMGNLLGHAVRFGVADDVLAAGEGIETVLSIREALPGMPLAAALSANHLMAILFPPGLRVLYILRDLDPAGDAVVKNLSARAQAAGIQPAPLAPIADDFNDDLCRLGVAGFAAHVLPQLAPEHVARFGAEPA